MAEGTFKSILQSPLPPPNIQSNLSVRFAQGDGILSSLVNLYSEVAQAQMKCAALMREAAAKSNSQLRQMRANTPMSSTMYSLWESSNVYVAQTAKALDQMASLTQTNVVEQLRHTSHNYRKVREQFSLQGGTAGDPGGGGGGGGGGRDLSGMPQDSSSKTARRAKRAEAKLQLAQEELETAQKSRDELIARFGQDLKPELLTKATERVKRALTLKAQAESEMHELNQGNKSSGPTSPISNVGAQPATGSVPLTKEVLKALESAERSRTQVIRDGMKSLARSYFIAMSGSCSPLLSFVQSVEAYSPFFDITSWLTKVMNVQTAMETPDLISCLAANEKAWLMKQGNEEETDSKALMDQAATVQSLRTLMKQKDQMLKATQEENALLKDEVNLLKTQPGFHEGAPERSSQGTEEPKRHGSIPIVASPPATGGHTPSLSLGPKASGKERKSVRLSGPLEVDGISVDDSQPLDASFPILSKQQIEAQHTPKQRSSSAVKHEKTSLLKRMATALKGGALNLHDESDHDASEVDSKPDQGDGSSQYDHDEFVLSEYIPSLKERLNPDLPVGLKTPDRLLELERRYEEYLWAMRNLHLANVIRNENWDCEGYMKGLDLEYGFQCYTVALPSNIPLAREVYVETPDALDWSAPSMTASDWSLFAYETLLIIYHSLSQALIAREIAKLPTQDIQEIKLTDFTVARPDKSELRAAEDRAGGRHRRYSLLVMEDVDRNEKPKSPPGGPKTFDDTTEGVTAGILESNVVMIRNLIRTWRVRLRLAAADNTTLTSLLLPSGLEFGEEGYALGFSPLDVRYRACRLHASWTMASQEIETQKSEKIMQSPLAKRWIFRQLHFIRVSVLMKIARLSRFLPQLKGLYRWLNDWSSRSNWHQLISKSIPSPEAEDDRFLKGNFSQLVECLKLSLVVLADFLGALQADAWGVDVYKNRATSVRLESYSPEEVSHSDVESQRTEEGNKSLESRPSKRLDDAGYGYRNAEGFLRLVALMSCISGVDKCIRYIVAEDEKALVMGGHLKNVVSKSSETENDTMDSASDADLDSNPQDAGRVLYGQNWKGAAEDFDLSAVLNANSVDVYWQYELPVQHLITSEFCHLVCDSQSPTKMVVDAPAVIQTIIIATHVMQHGYDPTLWSHLRVSQALMSLETIALYLIKALWDEALTSVSRRGPGIDEFEINLDLVSESEDVETTSRSGDIGSQRNLVPNNFMLSKELLTHLNVMASNFANWLATSTAATVPRTGTIEEGTTVSGGVAELGSQGASEANLVETRLIRILESTPPDLFDSLERPRGEYRNAKLGPDRNLIANSNTKITNSTDPDFCVLDLPVLNEIADRPNFFQQIESIREEPEGVSLILPSRVERVVIELCLRRLISNKFRNEFFTTLCNYRVHYETDTLAIAIQLWERISDLLVLTPVKFPPQPPDVNHFSLLAPLPAILSGPIAQYDLYRYMIVQTIRSMFERLFKEALSTIHNPAEEDAWFLPRIIDMEEEPEAERLEIEKAWSRVIRKFADGCQNFLNELRAELIHYTPVWTQFLPGNQHALICMHAADERLRLMFEDLSNSPFWPEEDLPPNSAPIVASFAHFDRLVKEIRIGTRFEQLLAELEPLSAPLASSAATSLNKKLRGIETILDRCIRAETWKPIAAPDSLHSVTAVDYMQFVHHILEAVWEFNASPEWILPIVVQFFGKMTRQFSDFIRASTADPRLTQVASKAQTTFKHLVSPIPRVDVSLISQLIGGAKDRRKKKGFGGMMAFVGLGGKKTKRKDLAHQLQALQKQQVESEDEGMLSPVDSGEEPGILSDENQSQSSGEESEKSRHRKKKSKKKTEVEEAEITEELKELAAKIGPVLAVSLTQVSAAVGKSPLPTWLTRLHNLHYFSSQLETIALKVIQVAIDQAASEDPQHNEILKALEKAGGRKAVFYDKHDRLDEDTKKKFSEWKNQLENAVEQCRRMISQRATETCYYTALRVVYHDLCCDLFEDLYSPSFSSGANLTNIVESLDHTVLKFVNAAPQVYKADLLRFIFHELIKAWAMLVTELGYAGHVFSPEDLAVVDSDLESIRQFAATHFIDTDMEVLGPHERGTNKDTPTQKINVFDYISEFIVFLGTQPLLLAQLGGNYQPEVKKKPLTSQPPGQMQGSSPVAQAPNEMANLFADMGVESAPAFNATDILGAKKKKGGGMFGGVLKAVGLKTKKPQSHPPPTTD